VAFLLSIVDNPEVYAATPVGQSLITLTMFRFPCFGSEAATFVVSGAAGVFGREQAIRVTSAGLQRADKGGANSILEASDFPVRIRRKSVKRLLQNCRQSPMIAPLIVTRQEEVRDALWEDYRR
jgi:hypothetical protein